MSDAFAKETDGFFARHFDRKISGAISHVLLKTPITPNQITLAVTLLGVWSGYLMAQPGSATKIEASLLFLLTSILDGCDGEVARAKKMTSKLGGWLDLWGDNIVHVAIFFGLGLGLFKDTGRSYYVTLGALAVLGTLVSASIASYQIFQRNQDGFTTVAGDEEAIAEAPAWKRRLIKLSDALARRDFVYGVVFLAFIDKLDWFLWACAIGSLLYASNLAVLFLFSRPSAPSR